MHLKMTSPKGMDKLFWGKEFEDVVDWMEHLEMALEVQGYHEIKCFKITKLNLRVKVKYWYKKLQPTPTD